MVDKVGADAGGRANLTAALVGAAGAVEPGRMCGSPLYGGGAARAPIVVARRGSGARAAVALSVAAISAASTSTTATIVTATRRITVPLARCCRLAQRSRCISKTRRHTSGPGRGSARSSRRGCAGSARTPARRGRRCLLRCSRTGPTSPPGRPAPLPTPTRSSRARGRRVASVSPALKLVPGARMLPMCSAT
jgi:hypothetical protein